MVASQMPVKTRDLNEQKEKCCHQTHVCGINDPLGHHDNFKVCVQFFFCVSFFSLNVLMFL